MSRQDIVSGGRFHTRLGSRRPAAALAVTGIALIIAAIVVLPEYQTMFLAWGGTMLFGALLLEVIVTGRAVSAGVASDIYTTMAANVHSLSPSGDHQYVPAERGVVLSVDDQEFDPIGTRLLAGTDVPDESVSAALAVLTDVVVHDAELAAHVTATVEATTATVTVDGSHVDTDTQFDHPVVSIIGVGLARHLGTAVGVETSVEEGRLVVTCEWSE